jgi:hypothetical protein
MQIKDQDTDTSGDDDSIDRFAGDAPFAEQEEVLMDLMNEETEESTLENSTSMDEDRRGPMRRTGSRSPDWQHSMLLREGGILKYATIWSLKAPPA